MKARHFKVDISPDGTLTLPAGEAWLPGSAEIIVLQQESPGAVLAEYAGMLDASEADAIRSAVAEACESVDPDAW